MTKFVIVSAYLRKIIEIHKDEYMIFDTKIEAENWLLDKLNKYPFIYESCFVLEIKGS